MDILELLKNGIKEFNIEIDDEILDKFIKYKDLLQEWNQKMNLTAITEDSEVIIKHFLDSISIMDGIEVKDGMKLIDVGTGAGFPGIPFKLLNPDANVVLLDSLNKRLKFLNELISQLELTKVNCIHMRAEDAGRDPKLRAKFDVAVSRAVAKLSILSEYCLPLIKVGGEFIAMKGPDVAQEIEEAEIAIEELGGEISDVKTILLPYSDIKHTLIVIKKIRQTSKKYPRISSLISKTPIE